MEERSFSISLTSLQKLFVAWEYQNFYYYLMYFLNPKSFVKSFLEIFFVKKMRRSNLHFSKDIFSDFQTAKSAHFSPITFSREKAFLKAFLKVSSLSFVMLFNEFCWLVLSALLLSLQKCIWHFCIIFIERRLLVNRREHYHFCICLSLAIYATK